MAHYLIEFSFPESAPKTFASGIEKNAKYAQNAARAGVSYDAINAKTAVKAGRAVRADTALAAKKAKNGRFVKKAANAYEAATANVAKYAMEATYAKYATFRGMMIIYVSVKCSLTLCPIGQQESNQE